MNFYARVFNLYLLSAALLVAVCGCQSNSHKGDKHLSSLRIYVESRAHSADAGKTVSVIRASPVDVTIDTEPALTEKNIIAAEVMETPGGVAMQVKFDDMGTLTLEQFSSAYQGKHFVIFGQWSDQTKDSRWLAAPIISHRIANGELSFTPDASREETKQLVLGLNNMAKQVAKGKMK